MLGQDAFATFEANGGLTRANGQRFRDMVLSRGNTLDYAEMYRAWAGHDPSIQPYLDYYGLGGTGAAAPAPAAPIAAPPPLPTPSPPAQAPGKTERGD
jgi:peptidyl-dipeptidase Dcp